MKRWLLVLLVVAAIAAVPAHACGCGVALATSVSSERALVIDRSGREEIVLSLDLTPEGAGKSAVVLPVPGDPEVDAITSGDPLQYLDLATAPPVRSTGGGEGAAAGAAPGVDVQGREVVGGYDVSRIAATDAGDLNQWLDDNGYTLPDGAEPILGDYVRQGWKFVAIQLAPGQEGRLKPLRVGFDTKRLVYPMKLSTLADHPITLTLYTLAGGARRVAGMSRVYAGRVDDLEPPPPAELKDLFAEGEYVTRLTADESVFTGDIVLHSASTPDDGGIPTWIPVLAAVALLGGLGLLGYSRTSR